VGFGGGRHELRGGIQSPPPGKCLIVRNIYEGGLPRVHTVNFGSMNEADDGFASCEGGAPTKVQLDHSVFTKCSPRYESLRLDADIARNPQQAGELGSFPRPSDRYIGKLEVFSPQNEYIWRASVPEQLLSPADIPGHIDHTILLGSERPRTGIDLHTSVLTSGRPSRLVCTILKLPFRIVR
jgi:hypothetical protein